MAHKHAQTHTSKDPKQKQTIKIPTNKYYKQTNKTENNTKTETKQQQLTTNQPK